MSASCQGGGKGAKRPSEMHRRITHSRKAKAIERTGPYTLSHRARTHARPPDGPIDRPDVHPQGSNSNSYRPRERLRWCATVRRTSPVHDETRLPLPIDREVVEWIGGCAPKRRDGTVLLAGGWRLALVGCVPWWWAGGAAAASAWPSPRAIILGYGGYGLHGDGCGLRPSGGWSRFVAWLEACGASVRAAGLRPIQSVRPVPRPSLLGV